MNTVVNIAFVDRGEVKIIELIVNPTVRGNNLNNGCDNYVHIGKFSHEARR